MRAVTFLTALLTASTALASATPAAEDSAELLSDAITDDELTPVPDGEIDERQLSECDYAICHTKNQKSCYHNESGESGKCYSVQKGNKPYLSIRSTGACNCHVYPKRGCQGDEEIFLDAGAFPFKAYSIKCNTRNIPA